MELYSESDEKRILPLDGKEDLPSEPYRDYFRRDYARILHSGAFRRLQGKTQLFPGDESDFFRNRLTHSLEVAQIGYDLAVKLNNTDPELLKHNLKIIPEICEIAGLIHDLGHPPFGHNGERALDDCMKAEGGFEGNAQTLRILLRLEKKERRTDKNGEFYIFDDKDDERVGLNLSARILASCIKYDDVIEINRQANDSVKKGYYDSERRLVRDIKTNVLGKTAHPSNFKTIECSIMDIADDIAYSTYDLEDSLKAGFLTPFDILSADDEVIEYIVKKCGHAYCKERIKNEIIEIFGGIIGPSIDVQQSIPNTDSDFVSKSYDNFIDPYEASLKLAKDGYIRNGFTSYLVNLFMNGVHVEINEEFPQLSKAVLDEKTRLRIDILKHFTFKSIINSSKLKIAEFRGYDIITKIFKALVKNEEHKEGHKLLPEDYQYLYHNIDAREQKRIIADFISGMTDRYALEFYCRLFSENAQTIFKPF